MQKINDIKHLFDINLKHANLNIKISTIKALSSFFQIAPYSNCRIFEEYLPSIFDFTYELLLMENQKKVIKFFL